MADHQGSSRQCVVVRERAARFSDTDNLRLASHAVEVDVVGERTPGSGNMTRSGLKRLVSVDSDGYGASSRGTL